MPYAQSGTARIYYEVMGDPAAPPILFVGGFSAQIIGWQEDFCRLIVAKGFRAIRFDNRDVGLSQMFDGTDGHSPGYTLHDMAEDGFAILDHLGIDRAHIVGQSMGGMIAQSMAGSRPERTISLTLVFTAPYISVEYLPPLAEVPNMTFDRVDRATFIERIVEEQRLNATDIYPFEEAWVREFAEISYDRAHAPEGVVRQLGAMLTDIGQPFTDHTRLTMPVALIHGRDDGRVTAAGSLELARLIPHAELHLYPGMGHFVVQPLWAEFIDIIARTARRGEKTPSASGRADAGRKRDAADAPV